MREMSCGTVDIGVYCCYYCYDYYYNDGNIPILMTLRVKTIMKITILVMLLLLMMIIVKMIIITMVIVILTIIIIIVLL